MAVCKTCPVNTVSKTEGLGECEPCEVGNVANLDRTNCGEFEFKFYKLYHYQVSYIALFQILHTLTDVSDRYLLRPGPVYFPQRMR